MTSRHLYTHTVTVVYRDGPWKGTHQVPLEIVENNTSPSGYRFQWNNETMTWEAFYDTDEG